MMSAGNPRHREFATSRPHPASPAENDHFPRERHGNAASAGADDWPRDDHRASHQSSGLRLSPEPAPAQADEAEAWSPRPLTVEELRARFREEARGPVRTTPGTPVDRLGRRLTDFDLVEQEERQRMPEPIPTSWQSPVMPEPPSAVMRHVSGGLMGLTLGLVIAVPGVLWYKGRIDPLAYVGMTAADLGRAVAAPSMMPGMKHREPVVAETPRAATAKVDVVPPAPPVEAPPQKVASVPVSAPQTATSPAPYVAPAPAPPPLVVPRYETSPSPLTMVKPVPVEIITTTAPVPPEVKPEVVILDDARRLIGEGDFTAARRMLENETVAKVPDARFLLAETYDPNFLAARGVRSVRAEVPRAIELYKEALAGGIDAARQRLTALRP
jgi:hypothetical protein